MSLALLYIGLKCINLNKKLKSKNLKLTQSRNSQLIWSCVAIVQSPCNGIVHFDIKYSLSSPLTVLSVQYLCLAAWASQSSVPNRPSCHLTVSVVLHYLLLTRNDLETRLKSLELFQKVKSQSVLSTSPTMSGASKPAVGAEGPYNLKEELFWVHCNKCAKQMGRVRQECSLV